MSNIRPQISYIELLAARQFINLKLIELEKKDIVRLKGILKLHFNQELENKIKDLQEDLLIYKDQLKKVDELFYNQLTTIEFQIDINYPII